MIMNAYSIFDMKALQYHLPFFQPADGAAIRMLMDLVNDPNTMVGRHPSDFVLYHVGHYDDARGEVQPIAPLRHIVDAVSLLRVQPGLFDAVAPAGAVANGEAR